MTSPRLVAQSISGPKVVRVGSSTVSLPQNSQTITTNDGLILYVLHEARLHVFTDNGEIEMDHDLRRALARKMFGGRQR